MWMYCNVMGCDGIVMCYERMTVSGLRNVRILRLKMLGREVDQREHVEEYDYSTPNLFDNSCCWDWQ